MAKDDREPKRLPQLEPGAYSDGHPLDEVHYLECKIILKPERFTSVKSFQDFGKLVGRVAEEAKVDLSTAHLGGQKPIIREVTFLDTPDFKLYNNAFILRRRVSFEDGFPVGAPEVVFKFRHPDLQTAAQVDVRPKIPGSHVIKFKAEVLPLKERVGGFRLLYSHNVEFAFDQVNEADRDALATLARFFPCLEHLKSSDTEKVELVNQMIVEEVLVELGRLDFGKGITAKTNAALWRARGDHRPLVGEFAFQVKFDKRDEWHNKARLRCEDFFINLQNVAADWVSLGTTKTGMVYRINGNTPQSHE